MCGILAILNNETNLFPRDYINSQFEKGRGRGPEFSVMKNVMIKADFGFHRLAINGLNPESNQPIMINNVTLICNGEIYNYKELYEAMDVEPTTDSDCEVIIHLYIKYGIHQTLQLLDGVFAFVLTDYRSLGENANNTYIARDPYGVRPLYYMDSTLDGGVIAFSSELKMISDTCDHLNKKRTHLNARMIDELEQQESYSVKQFTPGCYSKYDLGVQALSKWTVSEKLVRYHSTGFQSILYNNLADPMNIISDIQYYFTNAVFKRCCATERPIACLLSGGLDSSLVAALVNDFHIKHGLNQLETYSIGLAGSEDLHYARVVSDYLGTKHCEIVLTEDDFLSAIPDVIYAIESYDTTSVRASIGNWLLGQYISKNSNAKVIFNGDGSDELCGGYLYMHKAPDSLEFDCESRRLLRDIYLFDVLRSDKSISSHGLEPRTPFLDRNWVQYYLSIPAHIRNHSANGQCEKFLLRNAFSEGNYCNHKGEALLPAEILWRRKEAFSDGVSKQSRSLYQIIKEYCTDKFVKDDFGVFNKLIDDEEEVVDTVCAMNEKMFSMNGHLIPKTTEQYYYRKLFESYYPGKGKLLPYFWMPRYVNAKDASARTLDMYVRGNQGSPSTSRNVVRLEARTPPLF
jgi:asparagine synthase (glutamine-hydrolysing)